MSNVQEALEKLKKKGSDGTYPKGCIHDRENIVGFDASDYHHSIRICSKCLKEVVS